MKKIPLVALMVLLVGSSQLGAQYNKPGSTSAQFLRIGISARGMALGEAMVAYCDDVSALYYNPAGLIRLQRGEILVSHIDWPANINFVFSGVAYKITESSALGVSFANLYTDEMEVTTPLHPEGTGETFYASNYTVALSYAGSLTDRFSFGVNLRYIRLNLMNNEFVESSWALDVGSLFETGFRGLRLGMVIKSFGPNVRFIYESYALPTEFRAGISFPLLNREGSRLILCSTLIKPTYTRERAAIGGEYLFNERLALRAGYRFNEDALGWSLGLGVSVPLSGIEVTAEYAYTDLGFLFNTQILSIKVRF